MHCANWYHLYNLKNVKKIHGGVLLLPSSMGDFHVFLILQMLPNRAKHQIIIETSLIYHKLTISVLSWQ